MNQYHLKFINKYSLGGFKIVLQEKLELGLMRMTSVKCFFFKLMTKLCLS